jgi:hypothetical protein
VFVTNLYSLLLVAPIYKVKTIIYKAGHMLLHQRSLGLKLLTSPLEVMCIEDDGGYSLVVMLWNHNLRELVKNYEIE